MSRKLTKKQKGFVKSTIEGKSGTQAVLENYATTDPRTAAVIASENLTKPNIQAALEEAFPDRILTEIHLEGLYASHGIYRQTDEYKWVKIDEEPDHAVRHKFLESAYKLKGKYKDTQNNVAVFVQISESIASKHAPPPGTAANS